MGCTVPIRRTKKWKIVVLSWRDSLLIALTGAGEPSRLPDYVRRRVWIRSLAPALVPSGGKLTLLLEVSRESEQARYGTYLSYVVLYQCCGFTLGSKRFWIQLLTSMRIRIQGANAVRIRILVRLLRQKKLTLKMKNIVYVSKRS